MMKRMEKPYYEEPRLSPSGAMHPFQAFVTEADTEDGKAVTHPHLHDSIELIYGLEGAANAVVNGESYPFRAGDLVVVNANEAHWVVGTETGHVSYISIKFDPEILYHDKRQRLEARYVRPFTVDTGAQKHFTAADLADSDVADCCRNILWEYLGEAFGFELAIRRDLCAVFLWILRRWHTEGVVPEALPNEMTDNAIDFMQTVFRYVEKHYAEDLSVMQMAEYMHVSYNYFSRFFKQMMNRNFTDYLNTVRLCRASELLAQTNLPVGTISEKVGYATASYFIKQFRTAKGISPRRFRRQFRAGDTDIEDSEEDLNL